MKKIINYITKNYTFILLIISVVFIVLFFRQCSKTNQYKAQIQNNIDYYTDSLRTERTKNGKLEYDRTILITDKSNLEKQNKDLYNELQLEKGKVKVIIKEIIKIVHDTIYIHDTIISLGNDKYLVKWDYSEYFTKDKLNYQILNGQTVLDCKILPPTSKGTLLTKNEIGISLITGIKENKGKLEIYVRSDYPGFTITHLDGAIIDINDSKELKKVANKKRFGLGPFVGVGLGGNLKAQIFLGLGLTYSIIKF
jgi:hypothetical protein